jgi:DNA-binding MurR/RpiR family transcriptional regulator
MSALDRIGLSVRVSPDRIDALMAGFARVAKEHGATFVVFSHAESSEGAPIAALPPAPETSP